LVWGLWYLPVGGIHPLLAAMEHLSNIWVWWVKGKKEGESEELTHLTQEGSLEDTLIVV
jgi:hypothetical protein